MRATGTNNAARDRDARRSVPPITEVPVASVYCSVIPSLRAARTVG